MNALLWWQIVLLVIYAGYEILDELTIFSSLSSCVCAGFVAGLVMGDMKTGLFIGAVMQLGVLGVGTFGGASKIEATIATLLASVFAIGQGMNPFFAVGLFGLPLALILSVFDILARKANVVLSYGVDKGIEAVSIKKIDARFLLGALSWALSRMIPTLVLLLAAPYFVGPVVEFLQFHTPSIVRGFEVAGALTPAVGLAILLRFMPSKRYFAYVLLGFTFALCVSALSLPFAVVVLVGCALGLLHYQRTNTEATRVSTPATSSSSASASSFVSTSTSGASSSVSRAPSSAASAPSAASDSSPDKGTASSSGLSSPEKDAPFAFPQDEQVHSEAAAAGANGAAGITDETEHMSVEAAGNLSVEAATYPEIWDDEL